jgi:hypothetical protein
MASMEERERCYSIPLSRTPGGTIQTILRVYQRVCIKYNLQKKKYIGSICILSRIHNTIAYFKLDIRECKCPEFIFL